MTLKTQPIIFSLLTLLLIVALGYWATWMGDGPIIQAENIEKIAEHVYAIPDNYVMAVPNVGIVVGNKATLVIDPGLGPKNGKIVLQAVNKLHGDKLIDTTNSDQSTSRSLVDEKKLYITTTHFHPEHTLGVGGLGENAELVITNAQQLEMDSDNIVKLGFSLFSPVTTKLLWGVEYPKADVLFDNEYRIDLGGLTARLFHYGPMHTQGDTMIFIEEESVLFAGDIVMGGLFPLLDSESGSITRWLSVLDKLAVLEPKVIVGAHGEFGDIGLINRYRDFFKTLQSSVKRLKNSGVDQDEAIKTLVNEFADINPDWPPDTYKMSAAVKIAYREAL